MERLSKEFVVNMNSEAHNTNFKLLRGKKVLYDATLENGEKILLCTPESKYHAASNKWWVDITEIQKCIFDSYDKVSIVFRLEGSMLGLINWRDLMPFLTFNCMRNSKNEGDHWKIYIYPKYLKVQGNEKTCKLEVVKVKI